MAEGILQISYRNYRGEISQRKLVPIRTYWSEGNEYHPEPQYLMQAVDVTDPENTKIRDFAIKDFNPPSPEYTSGYVDAFYEISKMLGFSGAQANKSPKQMFSEHIRPQLAWLIEAGSKVGDTDDGQ